MSKIAIIGGGAAGFFSAIRVKENFPNDEVIIIEKTDKVLSKVKISGGGRCNVTNGTTSIKQLSSAYPRGGKILKKLFNTFSTSDIREWFESRNVPLIEQEDGCVFPVSQDSESIIKCFIQETKRLGISINRGLGVSSLYKKEGKIEIKFVDNTSQIFDKVIVTTGGSPQKKGLDWLEKIGHKIENPVPSLFTFKMQSESITKLMGIVVDNVLVNIQGEKLKSDGPLLITHWGMSGPAILKLSSFGARILSDKQYVFKVQVNWSNIQNSNDVMEYLMEITLNHPNKNLSNFRPYLLPDRLWIFLLEKCDLSVQKRWGELGKKGLNKLVNILTNDIYQARGKASFKEEFVTCGGVSLESIDIKTMQSKVVTNLYFAGEVLDIDGITGGYNFQAAWTTGYIAGMLK